VSLTGYELAVTYLQDWTAADGLSRYLAANDTNLKWFQMTLDDDAATVKAEGQARIVAGPMGGAGGAPLTGTVTMPIQGTPTFPTYTP